MNSTQQQGRSPGGSVGRDWDKVKRDAERLSKVTGAIMDDGMQELSDRAKQAIRYAGLALMAVLALAGVLLYSIFRLLRGAEVMIREYWTFTAGEELLITGGAGLFLVLTVLGIALRPRSAAPAVPAPGPDSTAAVTAADAAAQSAQQQPRGDESWKRRFLAVSREGQRLMSHLRRAMRHSMDPREWIAHSPFLSLAGGTVAGWFAGRSLLRPQSAAAAGAGAAIRDAGAERRAGPLSSILLRDLVMPAISQFFVAMSASKPEEAAPRSDGAEETVKRDSVEPQRPCAREPEHSGDPTFH